MPDSKTLTFALNDPPYENPSSVTALRLIERALEKGYHVNVFAFEGAAALPYTRQKPHANDIAGRDVEEEDHPLPYLWVEALIAKAQKKGLNFKWITCGLCADERGIFEFVEGTDRGGPPNFGEFAEQSTNTLVIPTH